MKRFLCKFCANDSYTSTAIGMLRGNVELSICQTCRDYVLTAIQLTGVAMTEDHPFISELCVDSHYVLEAGYRYHSIDSNGQGKYSSVIRNKR